MKLFIVRLLAVTILLAMTFVAYAANDIDPSRNGNQDQMGYQQLQMGMQQQGQMGIVSDDAVLRALENKTGYKRPIGR